MVVHKYILILLFILALLQGCTQQINHKLLQSKKNIITQKVLANRYIEYKILPQDRLSINLLKYPNISPIAQNSKGVLVNSLGEIYLPLIGKIKIKGLTQSGVARLLEEKYKKYLKNPTLYLEVINKRCYILGEVKKAGVVNMDSDRLTILEAIAYAGDLTDNAVRDNIIVVSHNINNNVTIRKIDLTNFDTLYSSNIIIKPNDIIYVQPNGWKEYKINANNIITPFANISAIIAPFITVNYLLR
ncbi:MAG: polysaccharide biosynthesis/export family protein [Sulfurovum sp.]